MGRTVVKPDIMIDAARGGAFVMSGDKVEWLAAAQVCGLWAEPTGGFVRAIRGVG